VKVHAFVPDGKARKIRLCATCGHSFTNGNHERTPVMETPVARTNYETELAFTIDTRSINARADVRGFFANEQAEKILLGRFADEGWRPDTAREPVSADALASILCHEDSGLLADPETAGKVAAFISQRYRVTIR
jgi:hypothetical protein